MTELVLPRVTLCAVTSVNVQATIAALHECLRQIEFGECLLFTDAHIPALDGRIRAVAIPRISSGTDYSNFLLQRLGDYVRTSHCLVIQWDGFVLDADRWDPEFLDYDYIGAPWPQFSDCHDVGNGGFSLRSRKLLESCKDSRFQIAHPEDVAIGRINREMLEREHGIRFADRMTAGRFAFERNPPATPTFGFHGIFNMIPALGPDRFWKLYRGLDDRRTAFVDYALLMRQLRGGKRAGLRRWRLTLDRARGLIGS